METKLERISQLSRENPDMVFTSVGHLINKEMLRGCHEKMDGKKAVGINGVTKEEYGRNLDGNLDALVERLKKKAYRPKPARKVEIPKDNGKTRPLSIYCYEDKLIQEALKEILEVVFEPHFYNEMMGFRPGRGCHMALRELNVMLERERTSYVLDADITGFFSHMNHDWIMKFIESKIKDPNITRLGSIRRITSLEGTEVAGFTYDAWGRPEKTVAEGYEASALSVANYTGHRYDEALELYYAKARIYSPEIGRFLSEDPIRDGQNWYTYANNNRATQQGVVV